jgi:hypothetical protein
VQKNYVLRIVMISTAHQIILGDQIEKNEMGGASSTYVGEERCIQDFGGVR